MSDACDALTAPPNKQLVRAYVGANGESRQGVTAVTSGKLREAKRCDEKPTQSQARRDRARSSTTINTAEISQRGSASCAVSLCDRSKEVNGSCGEGGGGRG
jgi:hypothetical protein